MLLLGGYIAEHNAFRINSSVSAEFDHVGLPMIRKAEQPKNRTRHFYQNLTPHIQSGRIDFVKLIEVAEHLNNLFQIKL